MTMDELMAKKGGRLRGAGGFFFMSSLHNLVMKKEKNSIITHNPRICQPII